MFLPQVRRLETVLKETEMRPLHSCRPRTRLSDAQQFGNEGIDSGMRAEDYLTDAERTHIIDEAEKQLLEMAQRHFPRTNNLEYAILKTHLLIENTLTQFIRCTSHVLVDPESLRFSFAQKLEIAVVHGFGHGCPSTVPSVELLNRIRNQIGHRFSIDMQLVNELIRINSEDIDAWALTDRQRIAFLRRWCYFISGTMAGHLKVAIE